MNPEHVKKNPFHKPHHICIVVKDIEKTKGYYESIGIGPWLDYPPLGEDGEIVDAPGWYAQMREQLAVEEATDSEDEQ